MKIFQNGSGSSFQTIERQKVGLDFLLKPFYFVLAMWFVFWLDSRFMLDLYEYGVFPRRPSGLVGVFASPLLHGSLTHLSNNTFPILALGAGLYYFYPKIAFKVFAISWLSSGLAVWLIGRESFHIGASGLIYALAGFIFLSGILRRLPNLLALSLLVVFLYGSLVWGVFPVQENISWEGHLAGAFSGFALAIAYRKRGPRRRKFSWEWQDEIEEADYKMVEKEETEILEEKFGKEYWKNDTENRKPIRYYYRPKNGSENVE